jgi:CRISPR-associated protein Cmr1
MGRKPKIEIPEGDVSTYKKNNPNHISMERVYTLITPMIGGGVEAGKVDTEMPIRATSIRGQLRFWWRATQWLRFNGSIEEMYAAEGQIWGSTATASPVSIAVKFAKNDQRVSIVESVFENEPGVPTRTRIKNQYQGLEVGLFPLRDSLGSVATVDGFKRRFCSFSIQVSFQDRETMAERRLSDEVKAALWAWERFGGVGARTRRGFGSVQFMRIENQSTGVAISEWDWTLNSSSGKKLTAELKSYLAKFVAEGSGDSDAHVPHLSHNTKFAFSGYVRPHPAGESALGSWLTKLKEFRQNRKIRPPGDPRAHIPSRSFWPEPDEVRKLFVEEGGKLVRSDLEHHKNPHYQNRISKFPRADFGLPIQFERTIGDHDVATLKGGGDDGTDRKSSPLIIKPLVIVDSKYLGFGVVLEGKRTPPGGLALEFPIHGHRVTKLVDSNLIEDEAVRICQTEEQNRGGSSRFNGKVDVLEAFLDYAKS